MSADYRVVRRWQRELHQRPSSRVVMEPTFALVQERWTKLTRLDPVTGDVAWSASVRGPWGWPVVVGDVALYLNEHSYLQAFELSDGSETWALELGPGIWGAPTAVDDRHVLVGGWRGSTQLRCLDARDGSTVWHRPAGQAAAGSPVITRAGIAVPRPGRQIIDVLDPRDGRATMALPYPSDIASPEAELAVDGAGRLFCCAARELLRHSPGDDARWEVISRLADPISVAAPTVAGGALVLHDDSRTVRAFDIDGRPLWSEPFLNAQLGARTLVCRTQAHWLVGSHLGRVKVLGASGGCLLEVAVAQRISTPLRPTAHDEVVFGTKGKLVSLAVV